MGWEIWQNLQSHGSLAVYYKLLGKTYRELRHYLEYRFESHQKSQSEHFQKNFVVLDKSYMHCRDYQQSKNFCLSGNQCFKKAQADFFFFFGLVLEQHLPNTVTPQSGWIWKKNKFHICLFARLLQKISNSCVQNPEEFCVRRRSNKIHTEFWIQASAFFTFPKRGNKAAVAAECVGVPFQSFMQRD